jgi:anti-sigma factor RsiW
MTCTEFVEGFSGYYDGTAPGAFIEEAEEHLGDCPTCRRYRHVMARGAELLRSLPEPEVVEDFTPRLQHRLYHVDEEASVRSHTSSGTTALAVVGMAVLLAAAAWSPTFRPGVPTVELEPIVVSRPPARALLRSFSAFPMRFGQRQSVTNAGLWDDASVLLFQHSRLYQRYGTRSPFLRTGLEQDR